ncbi:hypothetical protein AVEN_136084-1 [Araneus ventricosus]|uniref:Uncharacterized protein n=1 Tax=Araneus ventricosus TaxID=182803 RepID=A0A4Y2U7B5_ARAVE|nr:hypothetical protein AVEN_136084-1 [Araneus ventricosus]
MNWTSPNLVGHLPHTNLCYNLILRRHENGLWLTRIIGPLPRLSPKRYQKLTLPSKEASRPCITLYRPDRPAGGLNPRQRNIIKLTQAHIHDETSMESGVEALSQRHCGYYFFSYG